MQDNKINEMILVLTYYSDENLKIHVSRFDGFFHNGEIIKIDEENNLLILKDIMKGLTPIPINLIKRVDEYQEKGL